MTRTIDVEGMSCEHCERTVEESLAEVDGVTDATADHEAATVTVDGPAGREALVEAIESAGYEPSA